MYWPSIILLTLGGVGLLVWCPVALYRSNRRRLAAAFVLAILLLGTLFLGFVLIYSFPFVG